MADLSERSGYFRSSIMNGYRNQIGAKPEQARAGWPEEVEAFS